MPALREVLAMAVLLLPAFAPEPLRAQESPYDWRAVELDEVFTRLEDSGRRYEAFVETPTLVTGLYVLPAGAVDNQPVHELDEVYHVIAGSAVLKVGDDDVAVGPGAVVFVRAGVDHRFHDITEDLRVLVFFSKAPAE